MITRVSFCFRKPPQTGLILSHRRKLNTTKCCQVIWSPDGLCFSLSVWVYSHKSSIMFLREDYPDHGPSILSDAWLAIQGNHSLYVGSTWEWKSRNSSPNVSSDEASNALQELLPKASAVYPGITGWTLAGARAGLRAMPPLTPHGSLPLLGCVNNLLSENLKCKYWLLGGLGSRGLFYHGWLGKLTAEAVISCNEQIIPSELTSWKNKR